MKTVAAVTRQTPIDIAVQTSGSIEGLFPLLEVNPGMLLDEDIPAGTVVNLPGLVINKAIADHYSNKNLRPATGLGDQED